MQQQATVKIFQADSIQLVSRKLQPSFNETLSRAVINALSQASSSTKFILISDFHIGVFRLVCRPDISEESVHEQGGKMPWALASIQASKSLSLKTE